MSGPVAAAAEMKLRLQRWLSACRIIGGVDELIGNAVMQKRLEELAKIQGPQWGTEDAYNRNRERILKEYEDLRGGDYSGHGSPSRKPWPVWIGTSPAETPASPGTRIGRIPQAPRGLHV